jgi:hypothetical protein
MDFIDTFSNVVTTRLLGEESPDKYQELTSDTPGLETTTQCLRLGTGLKLTLVWSIFNALPQPIGQ